MSQPAADDDRDLIDVPIAELSVTAKGRQALADGRFEPAIARPGFDPELALDLLYAVAWWEDTHAAVGRSPRQTARHGWGWEVPVHAGPRRRRKRLIRWRRFTR